MALKAPLALALIDRGVRPPRPLAVIDAPAALAAVRADFLKNAEERLRAARRPLDRECARAELAILRLALGEPEGSGE
ncbi:MAG: hypothetical protein CL878_08800 [Dehalococcoidia bacterium]|nr:hypothetical protein [Dehalococcoidia bacterium]